MVLMQWAGARAMAAAMPTGKLRAPRLLLAILTLLLALVGPAAASASPHLSLRLAAETPRPRAGSRVTLAIAATPAPGWHGYWRNGGDAGVATRLAWRLPAGLRAGDPAYPVPGRLMIAGLMNYVYERPYALLVDLAVPSGLAPGTALPIAVRADYLVCSDRLCVPETQTLTARLTIGDGAIDAAARARFDAWRQAVPRPLGSDATYESADGRVRIAIPYPATAAIEDAYFYPLAPDAVDHAAEQRVVRSGDRVVIETAAPASGTAPSGPIAGVLAIGGGAGLSLTARAGTVPAIADDVIMTALLAFAGALAGGLLLNVMPCVFPILSLKALGLARAGTDARTARREALAYAAGVVLVCLALGGGLLALRAGGASVGWAFQLQDPRVILLLLLLVWGIALNLAGLFEVAMPASAGRAASRGAGGAFATGALAAFVATPCSGPFMASALGAALVLPWPAALAVFAGLGLGIALPFLAIGFVPALRRRLPRPGAWMARLRRLLAVPMLLTAAALLWVLWRQAGAGGVALGVSALAALALALAILGARHRRRAGGIGGAATIAALLAAAIAPVALVRAGPSARAGADQAYSDARLAQLRAAGRPVFVYFTADWCVTCKVNEAAAIDVARVRAAFRDRGVAVLAGDWTDGDPAIGRALAAHGRAGVPLYLWYPPGGAAPAVLPQILTPAMLTERAAAQ